MFFPLRLRLLAVGCVLSGALAASGAVAGPLEDGQAAHDRGDYAAAIALWRPLAEQGDGAAQLSLGRLYEQGRGVTRDAAEALQWYRRAADQQHPGAQDAVSGLLSGAPRTTGDTYQDGARAYERGDYGRAAELWRSVAERGSVVAQMRLSRFYTEGPAAHRNEAEGARWTRLAAEQGYSEAQHNYAEMLETGRGVARNDTESLRWYRAAAEQGHGRSLYMVGVFHMVGAGGAVQDLRVVADWFRRAADAGNIDAMAELAQFYLHGTGPIQVNPPEAARLLRLAVREGHAKAQYLLGVMHNEGLGMAVNRTEALRLWRLSARQGFVSAQRDLQGAGLNW